MSDNLANLHYTQTGLKFIVCGSVDNGKSTLLGRLLYESGAVFQDQLNSIIKKSGMGVNTSNFIDYSYLLDGLYDERQQNITIDVAHRHFRTNQRNFILLDTPGHDQYVRNMAVAASQAEIAILVVDVLEGLTVSAIRHANILHFMGVKKILVCINKMDLIEYKREKYYDLVECIKKKFFEIGINDLDFVPVSAIHGDNIVNKSVNLQWYHGEPLIKMMEESDIQKEIDPYFCLPVQYVIKQLSDGYREYAGLAVGRGVSVGDSVKILPSGQIVTVDEIIEGKEKVAVSTPNTSLSLRIKEHAGISRGDFIVSENFLVKESNQFRVRVAWFDNNQPLLKFRKYIFKHAHSPVLGMVNKVKHVLTFEELHSVQPEELRNNDIGVCNICLDKKIYFLPYIQNRELGSFIIIDRISLETVGIAIIEHALDRSNNITMQSAYHLDKNSRAEIKHQRPFTLWLTGLSGSGKSTVANLLERRLHDSGYHTYVIDGDNIRHGLNSDLGFKNSDRVENMRRIAEVASMFMEAGLIVIVAAISPFRMEREDIKNKMSSERFIEVFVDASLETCMKRDPKKLYQKQAQGEVRNFTGISSPYEAPINPDIHLDNNDKSIDQLVDEVAGFLFKRKFINKEV